MVGVYRGSGGDGHQYRQAGQGMTAVQGIEMGVVQTQGTIGNAVLIPVFVRVGDQLREHHQQQQKR